MSFSTQFGEKVNFLANIDVTKKSFEVDAKGRFKEKSKWSGIRNFFARAIYYISCTLIRPNPKIDQVALEFMQNAKQLIDTKTLDNEDQKKLKGALSNLSKILHDNGGTKEGIINRFILTMDKITELPEVKKLTKPNVDESLEALLEDEDEDEEVPFVSRNQGDNPDPDGVTAKNELDKLEEEYNRTKETFDQRMAIRDAKRKDQKELDKTNPFMCAELRGSESAQIFNLSDDSEFMLKLFEQKMLNSKEPNAIEFLTNLDVKKLVAIEYSSYDTEDLIKTTSRFFYLLQKVTNEDHSKNLLLTFCKALPKFPEDILIDILSQKQKVDILSDDRLQFTMRTRSPETRFVLAFDTNNEGVMEEHNKMGYRESLGVISLLKKGDKDFYVKILEQINPNMQKRSKDDLKRFEAWATQRNISM